MTDTPFDLGLEEPLAIYANPSQRARVFTESWVAANLFCPNCGARRIIQYPNNMPVADFYCADCQEQFELKSKKGRMGPKGAAAIFPSIPGPTSGRRPLQLIIQIQYRRTLSL
jgi:type II restriction enzyme